MRPCLSSVDSSRTRADLTVVAEVHNLSDRAVSGTLRGAIDTIRFSQPVSIGPRETTTVRFTPEAVPALRVASPALWWPAELGRPTLHPLDLEFAIGSVVSDHQHEMFGIREITSELTDKGVRLFKINGRPLLVRGGGWAPDMLLRESPERLKTQFDYLLDLNLNAIRLEGPMESDAFFDLADQEGILVMAGWTCCDYWQKWTDWKQSDIEIATASLRSQIARLRSHPSMLAWLNGSDQPPPAMVEHPFLAAIKELDWPNPVLSSASENITPLTGRTGVKMRGPYDYTPPDYWLADTSQNKSKLGGAYGFATEIGTGPAIPPFSSLERMLPKDHIVPGDAMWNYHAGSERFSNLKHFEDAMNAIYGPPRDFADYERKAQAMAYDSERAMFEAYSRNKYTSTGVIQWMLNNAWPSLIWHLWDYYLQPAGGYYGVKKACEPLHIMYSYDDRSVAVVNSTYQPGLNLSVTAKLFDSNLHERFSVTVPVDVAPDAVTKAGAFPEHAFDQSSPVYFVDLVLKDQFGKVLSTNFYWLSAKQNVYDWSAEDNDAFTPVKSYEDLTALNSLPNAGKIDVTVSPPSRDGLVRATLHNPTDRLAFQVSLDLRNYPENGELSPVLWDDNYIPLLPGESRVIFAHVISPTSSNVPSQFKVVVRGWNINPQDVFLIAVKKPSASSGASH